MNVKKLQGDFLIKCKKEYKKEYNETHCLFMKLLGFATSFPLACLQLPGLIKIKHSYAKTIALEMMYCTHMYFIFLIPRLSSQLRAIRTKVKF